MSEELSSLIKRKETELEPLRSQMEELRLLFTAETALFVTDWYMETTKNYVAKYPEVILGMKESQIGKIKAEVNELAKRAKVLVDEEFSKPALWWHLNPELRFSIDAYKQVADKYPELLDDAVRRVLGRLGGILEMHGFNVATSRRIGAYPEFWFRHLSDEDSATVPYYPHLLKWSQQMQDVIQMYNAKFEIAILLHNEIKILKERFKKEQAKARWDSM
jgi:hypothetical protein